jgi:hypothetical protein
MLAELQSLVEAVAEAAQAAVPKCPRCEQAMKRKDTRRVSWIARFWTPAGLGSALPLRGLPHAMSTATGRAWGGTGTDQRFAGPIVGAVGSGGAVSAGGASGVVVIGGSR